MDSLSRQNAVVRCRTGEIYFMDDAGCDITPKGEHVHCQMKQTGSGHWYLPIGRYSDAMIKLERGHLIAAGLTPAKGSYSSAAE